jgi:hypothetical protein
VFCSSQRSCTDSQQFVCFLEKKRKFIGWHNSGISQEFEPEYSFVRFLDDYIYFGNELGVGARPANRPIVCSDRGTATKQLFADYVTLSAPRQGPHNADDSDCKLLRPQFHRLGSVQHIHCFQ